MPFKIPSVGAVLMLTTFVFGGIGLAYLPTQISDTPGLEDTWQARWGPEISTVGLLVVGIATLAFVVTHIRWPQWIVSLRRFRVRFYKTPYWPDEFLTETLKHIPGTLKVVKRTVEMRPGGWDERDPFIRITYSIFNGTPFLVFFEAPTGELSVGQSKLHEEPKIHGGQGWYRSHDTARLQIDQRMKLEFWQELNEPAKPEQPLDLLRGGFNVLVKVQHPRAEDTRIGLQSETPFLVERPRN